MSDPLERLRGTPSGGGPDVDAIRSRARRIERRRYMALGGGAVAIALVAIAGVLIGVGPNERSRNLAESRDREASASPMATSGAEQRTAGTAATRAAPAGGAFSAATGGKAASPQPAGAPSSESALAAQDRSGNAELTLTLTVNETLAGADLTLRVCNKTTETIEKTFSTAQRYDFEVSRDGDRVWRWSDGRVFAQVYGQETWEPDQCKSYSESWDGRDSEGNPTGPGEYQAVGVLSSSPPLRSAPKSFCRGAC
jgi:hypothetical protein